MNLFSGITIVVAGCNYDTAPCLGGPHGSPVIFASTFLTISALLGSAIAATQSRSFSCSCETVNMQLKVWLCLAATALPGKEKLNISQPPPHPWLLGTPVFHFPQLPESTALQTSLFTPAPPPSCCDAIAMQRNHLQPNPILAFLSYMEKYFFARKLL